MKEHIEKAALLEDLNHAGILSEFVKFKIERFPAADVAEGCGAPNASTPEKAKMPLTGTEKRLFANVHT